MELGDQVSDNICYIIPKNNLDIIRIQEVSHSYVSMQDCTCTT